MTFVDATGEPLPSLRPRSPDSHKGDFGRVIVVGGSAGKAGAAALTVKAALRSGGGLVTVVTPRSVQNLVASFEPSYMTLGLGTADFLTLEDYDAVQAITDSADCVAVGPGLGTETATMRLVQKFYHTFSGTMVVDADALNALAAKPELLERPGGPRILTPHPGEYSRLADASYNPSPSARHRAAVELAARDKTNQTVVVLKGNRTVISDGKRYAENSTGNPGMATGGTGDVLTGVLAGLTGQGLAPWEAARLGVYVHGLAGDLAADELGQIALIASDLLNYLPTAFQKFTMET